MADSPGSSSSSPYTPMSERQQLAMIKQMTEQTSTPDKSGNSPQSRYSTVCLLPHTDMYMYISYI